MRACWIKLTTGAVAPRPSCFRFNAVMRVQFTLVKARCQSALAGPTLASDESRGTFAKVDADAVKYNLPFLSFSVPIPEASRYFSVNLITLNNMNILHVYTRFFSSSASASVKFSTASSMRFTESANCSASISVSQVLALCDSAW